MTQGSYIYRVNKPVIPLTIFSIATDRYLKFWSTMVDSYIRENPSNISVHWMLLTNLPDEIEPSLKERLGNLLTVRQIEHQPWPLPTLLRYQYLIENKNSIIGNVLMYIDADMLFQDALNVSEIVDLAEEFSLVCISHPGYYRPRGPRLLKLYLENPRMLISDLKSYLRFGGLGTWENSRKSTAYVPRLKRANYVCGGVWFGTRSEIIEMSELLNIRVHEDLANGTVAKFHDESHLNRYIVDHSCAILTPRFCHDSRYPQLRGISPIISAVDKSKNSAWLRQ